MAVLRKFTFISNEGFTEEQDADSMLSFGKATLLGVDGTALDVSLAKIISLANGTSPTDAINLSQLTAVETALDGRLDSIENNLSTEIATVFENNTGVIADGAAPTHDAAYREGWYFTNASAGQKINWYFFDGQAENVSLGEFSGQPGATGGLSSVYAVVTMDNVTSGPILAVYTTPTGSGDAAAWYKSRVIYSMPSNSGAVAGKKYLVHAGPAPSVHPDLPRIQLVKASNSAGTQAANERILTMSLGTNSGAAVGNVQMLSESVGIVSATLRREVLFRFRRATLQSLDAATAALDARLDVLEADPVTKTYVDNAVQGLDVKLSVRAGTTGNITLSGLQTVDGVSLAAGDRVLVMAQNNAAENGIYVVSAGAWARATDANSNADVTSGMFAFVEEGTACGNNGYVLVTDNPITLGTTALTFTQFTGAGQVVAGNGLEKTGNRLDVTDSPLLKASHLTGDALSVGDPVVFSSTANTLGKAAANSNALARVVGVSLAATSAGGTATIVKRGTAAGVLSGATPGEPMYLGTTGGLSSSAPLSGRVIRVGFAINSTDLEVEIADYGQRA